MNETKLVTKKQSTKTLVVIVVDTEADNAWENHRNPLVTNVYSLLRLQELLDRYGAKATLVVTSRVIGDVKAIEVLRELADGSGAEIGAHLHPWESPPFMPCGSDVEHHTYPHELPLDVFEQKLQRLVEEISRHFNPPTSYRAGRWGIAPEHIQVLERLCFQVDSSVTPLIDWRRHLGLPKDLNGKGGIDYRFAPQHPYQLAYQDINRKGEAKILEIPVSVAFTRRTPALIRRYYGRLPVLMHRILRKLEILRPVWAMPTEYSGDRLQRMLRVALKEKMAIINMTIHSSELMCGTSPRSRTNADVDTIFRRLEVMLDFLAANSDCEFVTLTEAAHWWQAVQTEEVSDRSLTDRGPSRHGGSQYQKREHERE